MSFDITFCSYAKCKDRDCERHQRKLKNYLYPVSIGDCPRCENWENGKWAIDSRFQKRQKS